MCKGHSNVTELGSKLASRVILKSAWPPQAGATGVLPSFLLLLRLSGSSHREIWLEKQNLKVTSVTLKKPPSGGDHFEVSLCVARQTDTLLLE